MSCFCPIPWLFQAPRANGDLRVCCQANNTPTAGIIRKPDGTAYNAKHDNLEESRNAELLKTMRKNMLSGVWSEECQRCKHEEDNGQHSRRMYELENLNFSFDDATLCTTQDGKLDTQVVPIQYYDFRFGNKCNLACRMCGPTDSDFWYDDWKQIRGEVFHDNGGEEIRIGVDNPYDWHSSEHFWKQIEDNIDSIRHIYFAGGEPLLIQRHYDFLEKCVKMGVSKNISIEYNTNLTTLPPRVLSLWTMFKKVKIGASIDGYGDVLEYQRYPAKWDKIYKNLLALDSLGENIESWITCTITVYNVEHVFDFAKWIISQKFKNINKTKPLMTYHFAYGPHHVNIQALPKKYKNYIKNIALDFAEWARYNSSDYGVQTQGKKLSASVISHIDANDLNDSYGDYLKEYTLQLDKIRNQSVTKIIPNLARHIL